MRIVMDTNFIMEVVKNKIDLQKELKRVIDSNFELYVIEGTKEELEKIAETQRNKDRETAKIALELIKNIKTAQAEGKRVDEKLLDIAEKDTVIATHDKELKKKIKGRKIVVRQKKYLQLV